MAVGRGVGVATRGRTSISASLVAVESGEAVGVLVGVAITMGSVPAAINSLRSAKVKLVI